MLRNLNTDVRRSELPMVQSAAIDFKKYREVPENYDRHLQIWSSVGHHPTAAIKATPRGDNITEALPGATAAVGNNRTHR